jgi:hypothetical protein
MRHSYVHLIIVWLVVGFLAWVAGRMPIDAMFLTVARAIALLVLVLYTLQVLGFGFF